MGVPTSAHIIYIPVVLAIGLVLGFIFGARATRESIRLQQMRDEERTRKKAERAAAREKATAAPPSDPPKA